MASRQVNSSVCLQSMRSRDMSHPRVAEILLCAHTSNLRCKNHFLVSAKSRWPSRKHGSWHCGKGSPQASEQLARSPAIAGLMESRNSEHTPCRRTDGEPYKGSNMASISDRKWKGSLDASANYKISPFILPTATSIFGASNTYRTSLKTLSQSRLCGKSKLAPCNWKWNIVYLCLLMRDIPTKFHRVIGNTIELYWESVRCKIKFLDCFCTKCPIKWTGFVIGLKQQRQAWSLTS